MNQHTPATALSPAAIERRERFCRELMQSAAAMALAGFRSPASYDLKGPQDFLTETDGAVERHIRQRIAEAFPEDGFLGEETGGVPGNAAWVVDPIDGTANFARRVPHFCISVAFVADGRIELGAIANPAYGEFYHARLGHGATRNDIAISVADTSRFDAACFELGWSRRIPTETYLSMLGALMATGANVRRGASGALGLAYVADGRSDGYAELHMNSWDCLAGLLLVHEAGGVTGDFLAGDGLMNGGPVLAAAPGVAAGLIAASGIDRLVEPGRVRPPQPGKA